MKKKYYLIASALFLLPTVCYAGPGFETKESIRKELISECIRGSRKEKWAAQFCECTVNQVMEKYSLNDLKAIETTPKKAEKFKKDLADAALSKKCVKLGTIDACKGAYARTSKGKLPEAVVLKYCNCAMDKMLEKYSPADLVKFGRD